jgi:hypothetical protein
MKKTILTVAMAVALGASAHAQTAAAPLADLSIKVNADYESEYVFRGKKITTGAFQPSINLTYPVGKDWGTVGAYIWNSDPIGRRAGSNGPNFPDEVDIGGMWDYDLSKASSALAGWTAELGDQEYWYPQAPGYGIDTVSRSNELHANLGYDTTSLLFGYNIAPTFWYYHDVVLDSNTLAVSFSYTWDLSKMVLNNLSIIPSATFGWTGIHRSQGDQNPPASSANYVPQWRDSYAYYLFAVEADYKIKDWATAFIGIRLSGNNDGTSNGLGGGNPQAPAGGQNQVWAGIGLYMGE